MNGSCTPIHNKQEVVNEYFQNASSYWNDIYGIGAHGAQGEIYRARHERVIEWIRGLNLSPGSKILEVGCGSGLLSIELARDGFTVQALDSTEEMVTVARRNARRGGVSEGLSFSVSDAAHLACEPDTFDLTLAIGVVPWVEHPERVIREMARVTVPNGYVLFSADNRSRLNHLVDPRLFPPLAPIRSRLRRVLVALGLRKPPQERDLVAFHSCDFIDGLVAGVGLTVIQSATLGFGPFTLFGRGIFPDSLGVTLHRWLQRLSDRRLPGLRETGSHYLVLARKSAWL